jgi:hypothetical protein
MRDYKGGYKVFSSVGGFTAWLHRLQTADPLVEPGQQPFMLKLGEIVQGTVLKLHPQGLATMQIRGTNVIAQLDTPLELGQKPWLQAQSATAPFTLKVISAAPHTPGASVQSSLTPLLQSLGFADTPVHRALLERTLQERIPLQSTQTKELNQLLRNSTGDAMTIEAILYSLRKGLPLTPEVTQSIREFFSIGTVHQKMNQVIAEIDHHVISVSHGREPLALEERLRELDLRLRALLREPVSTIAVPGQQADVSSDASRLESSTSQLKTQQDFPVSIKEFLTRLGVAHESKIMRGAHDPEEWKAPSVKQLLLQIQDDAAFTKLSPVLQQKVGQLLGHITGQQLVLTPDTETPFQHVFLQIPLVTGNREDTSAFVQIHSRRQEKGMIDPNHCSLFFYLQLAVIGETHIRIEVVDRVMNMNIAHSHPLVSVLAQEGRVQLEQSLTKIGYRLSNFKVGPIEVKQESRAAKDSGHTAYPPKYQGMDIKI